MKDLYTSQIPFGLKNHRMVDIDGVASGLACGCVCPGCFAPLVARKGEIRIHHFSHAPGHVHCKNAVETSIHRMAKQIISDSDSFVLPAHVVEVSGSVGYGSIKILRETLEEETRHVIHNVDIEKGVGPFRADAVFKTSASQEIVIEVAVTNRSSSEKIKTYREHGVRALEIDLSGLGGEASKDVLEKILLGSSNRKVWISHPGTASSESRLRRSLAALLEPEREALKAKRRAEKIEEEANEAKRAVERADVTAALKRLIQQNPRCEKCRRVLKEGLCVKCDKRH